MNACMHTCYMLTCMQVVAEQKCYADSGNFINRQVGMDG